jgi:hypothetical protein
MDDIDRAQIGKRREVAREQINHPKIPKTNLPPMIAKGVDDKYKVSPLPYIRPYTNLPDEDKEEGLWGCYLFLIICIVLVITKLFGIW